MSGAAQRDDMTDLFDLPATGTGGGPALKDVVAERLAAHRSRQSAARAQQLMAFAQDEAAARRERAEARRGTSRVRDAVTARFHASQSYREYLAAEAERAITQAEAEAEMAARKARAVAEAQMQLLEEMEQWPAPEPTLREEVLTQRHDQARGELAHALADIVMGARELIAEPIAHVPAANPRILPAEPHAPSLGSPAHEVSAAGLTVRLFEEISRSRVTPSELRLGRTADTASPGGADLSELEEEIEFRRAPEFEPHIIETTPIPANLIEFPRQLIAPRKARPRLAEGPLREEVTPEPQLRIFEVEPEQVSAEPVAVADTSAVAEWQTLLLDGSAVRTPAAPAHAQASFTMTPQTAPLELRLMAAAVDGSCLLGASLAFAAVAIEVCGSSLRAMPKPMLAASVVGVLVLLVLGYQFLFFTLSDATPGMRYARIALCTFGDDNPSRKAMRRRIGATLLAASPLALGLAWAFFDEERLGWHDRISRMYQRAY